MKKNSICKIIVSGLLTAVPLMGMAQQVCGNKPWSVRMAESEMVRCPESWQLDFQTRLKWDYCHGLELQAMLDVYDAYGDKKFFDYAVAYADTMIHQDGSIETYKLEEYNIDRLNSGKMLFRIYEQTKDEKYKKALDLLRSQLDTHPRNADGGFWHKKIYENQMWLDGLYMGQPFYAEYAYRNNRVNDYADIINQFVTVARHNYDPKTDLYRHACDVSKREKWADKTTGLSQHCWGRAMGWYAMACVDVLDFIPEHEAGRESVIEILNKLVAQIKRTQDPATGVWYQVIDRSGDEGNYLESSCSTMFVYTLLKALRKGYICPSYMEVAKKGYEGLLTQSSIISHRGTRILSFLVPPDCISPSNHSFFITSTPFFSSAAISSSRFAASSFVIGSLGPFDLRIFPLAKKADNIRSGKHPSISAPTNPPKDKPTICAFRICKASIKATRSSAWVNWKSSVCLDEMPYPRKSYRIAR